LIKIFYLLSLSNVKDVCLQNESAGIIGEKEEEDEDDEGYLRMRETVTEVLFRLHHGEIDKTQAFHIFITHPVVADYLIHDFATHLPVS